MLDRTALEKSAIKYGYSKNISDSSIHISEYPGKEAFTKIKAMSLPLMPHMPSMDSLIGRVTENPIETVDIPQTIDKLEEMSSQFPTVEEAIAKDPEFVKNYIITLHALIASILIAADRKAINEREHIETLKKRFQISTLEGADLVEKNGWNGLGFSLVSLAGLGLSAVLLGPKSNYHHFQEFANGFAGKLIPEAGSLFKSKNDAQMQKSTGVANLTLQDYTNKSQKQQDQSTELYKRVLDDIFRQLKEAARAG